MCSSDLNDLTALDRAEAVARLAKNALLDARSNRRGGHQKHDKGVSKVARVTGMSRESASRSLKIATISRQAKKVARAEGLDKTESALLKIAKGTTCEEQLSIARKLSKPRLHQPLALSGRDRSQLRRLCVAFQKDRRFRDAWRRSSKTACNEFIKQALRPTLHS